MRIKIYRDTEAPPGYPWRWCFVEKEEARWLWFLDEEVDSGRAVTFAEACEHAQWAAWARR